MSNGRLCLGRDDEINRVVYDEGWGPAMLSVAQSSAELSPPRPSRFPKSYFYDSVKLTLRILHGSMQELARTVSQSV